MGAASTEALTRGALAAVLVLAGTASAGAAEPACLSREAGTPYAVCFDLGNSLSVTGGVEGWGAEIALRHGVRTDDPTVWWRFQHEIAAFVVGWDEGIRGTLYEGRFLRHSRDGYLTLPTSPPRRLSLPFDVGAEATVLRVSGRLDEELTTVRVVRAAAIFDLARSEDFRRRLTIGAAVRWDADLRRRDVAVLEHRVAPFSAGALDGWIESADGLVRAGARVEGGVLWSTVTGWRPFVEAEASLERVVLAVNDQPVALYVAGTALEPGGVSVAAGVRFALLGARRSRSR